MFGTLDTNCVITLLHINAYYCIPEASYLIFSRWRHTHTIYLGLLWPWILSFNVKGASTEVQPEALENIHETSEYVGNLLWLSQLVELAKPTPVNQHTRILWNSVFIIAIVTNCYVEELWTDASLDLDWDDIEFWLSC